MGPLTFLKIVLSFCPSYPPINLTETYEIPPREPRKKLYDARAEGTCSAYDFFDNSKGWVLCIHLFVN